MNRFLTTTLCGILALASRAATQEFEFTYAPEGETPTAFGTGKYVDYDVAIKLSNPAFAGFQIVGVQVGIPSEKGTCDPACSAWITSELKLDADEKNIPDIASQASTIINKGTKEAPQYEVDVRFDNPYTLTGEPVYVGYSVHVNSLEKWSPYYPVITVPSQTPQGGLYLHCSRTSTQIRYLEWTDLAETRMAVSTMKVILRGEKQEFMVNVSAPEKIYALTGKTGSLPLTLINNGSKEVSDIDYEIFSEGSILASGHYDISIPATLGASAKATLPFSAPGEKGYYPATLKITKVNGNDNPADAAGFSLVIRDFLPTKRPLVEEYTGLWCQYCPQAYVAAADLRDAHPDKFICLAYHNNDAMMTISPALLPVNAGAPAMYLDRVSKVANYGALVYEWTPFAEEVAPADVDVKIYWTDDTHTALRAESTMTFMEDAEDADYSVTYAMVEDEMTKPDWKQRNAFYGAGSAPFESKHWELFEGKGFDVKGIIYDDVVLVAPDVWGMQNSAPSSIKEYEKYAHHTELKLSDAINVYQSGTVSGENIIIDKEKIRVVALLIDNRTKRVVNCNTSGYSADAPVYDPSTSGIDRNCSEIESAEVASREIFTLSGVRLGSMPDNGAVIIVEHLTNGKTRTAKILQ